MTPKPANANPPTPAMTFDHLAHEGVFDRPAWLLPLRRAAMAEFVARGFPTPADEDWRFTNIAAAAKLPIDPLLQPEAHGLTAADVAPFLLPGVDGPRAVFLDGHFVPEWSSLSAAPGVTFASLRERLQNDGVLIQQQFGRFAGRRPNPLVSLNTAFFQDGFYLHLAPGCEGGTVQVVFLNRGSTAGRHVHVRNLVLAERNSRVTLVESYVSLGHAPTVTNSVTEAVVGDNAVVEHVKFQNEGEETFHFATLAAEVGRTAKHLYHSLATGARLSRTNIHEVFNGEGGEGILNGLYLIRGRQLADHHMIVEHAQPHCASHEYFNGILAGESRGVFHGRILVQPGAQKTDAKQTNKNLLLSNTATANAKPQLEIYADDVKCTHGATIGQLNEDAVYYLRSRGIGAERARRMLVHAFAGEILDRIESAPVREFFDRFVWQRLEENPEIATHD